MMLDVTGWCFSCKKQKTVSVPEDGWNAWKNGEGHIQDLMPEVSPADREFLISGTCGPCFNKMFPSGDD